jgi:hypothetical protein
LCPFRDHGRGYSHVSSRVIAPYRCRGVEYRNWPLGTCRRSVEPLSRPSVPGCGDRKRYTTAVGRFDLYLLYFERALSLLHPSGRLVFITPEKFLYVETAAPLRRLLASHGIDEIRMVDENTFPNLTTYPTILPGHHPARLGLGAPQDATGAERCAVSVGPVDRMFATPPDSPGQCEPGLSDDRPRDPRLCYCPELSPRATRSSSS